jgi:RNA polymerase sigma-70 factor (ECF subfamily)
MSASRPRSLEDLLAQTGWTRRLAQALVGDEDAADDLVQETLVAGWRSRPRGDRSLRPWLRGVLLNLVRTRARAGRRRAHWEAAAGAEGVDRTSDAEQLLAAAELQRMVVGLLLALDEPFRQTLLLRFFEGRSSREIGAAMAVSPATARWRLKVGLEQLRAALDARNDGDRPRWQRALVPLARLPLPAAPALGLGAVGLAAGLALVAAGAVLVARTSGAPGAIAAAVVAPAGPPVAEPRPPRTPVAGATAPVQSPFVPHDGQPWSLLPPPTEDPGAKALAPCRSSLDRLHAELAEAEMALRRRSRLDTLFALGDANPAARAQLVPLLERALRGDGGAPPPFTLECRSWACRFSMPLPPRRALWMDQLRLLGRARVQHASLPPQRDPATGEVREVALAFISLEEPNGQPLLPGLVPASSPRGPAPGTLPLCQKERSALVQQIAVLRRTAEGMALDLAPAFQRAPPNPALARELGAEVRAMFGADVPPDLTVECRGLYCRMAAPATAARDDLWRMPLRRDPAFARRIRLERAALAESYLLVVPAGWRRGRDLLEARLATLEQSSALDRCQARFPAERGELSAQFEVPWPGELDGEGRVGRISFQVGGSLQGTPLGRCVLAAIDTAVTGVPLPDGVTGSMLSRRFTFPRGRPPDAGAGPD